MQKIVTFYNDHDSEVNIYLREGWKVKSTQTIANRMNATLQFSFLTVVVLEK